MTVLEPTPERTHRPGWLRRATFVASAAALTLVFALSLTGIASTQGTSRPAGLRDGSSRRLNEGDGSGDP